jgi:hypothetical protein
VGIFSPDKAGIARVCGASAANAGIKAKAGTAPKETLKAVFYSVHKYIHLWKESI